MKKARKKIKASILIIGNEVLSGRTQDLNVSFISNWLNINCGISVTEVRIVPDVEKIIIYNVLDLSKKFNYVFTTGGIGPTHDDITSLSIAKAFKVKYEYDPRAYAILEKYYGKEMFNLARKNKDIFLFGKGEERRDHIYIDDLINVLFECIESNKFGVFNLASGKVTPFNKVAKIAISLTGSKSKIFNTKRIGTMPHNGYRPFNVSFIKKNFKKIELNTIESGMKKYLRKLN